MFSRRLLETAFGSADDPDRYRLFYGTPVRARHTNSFIYTFDRAHRARKEVDPDGMICDALDSTSHGLVYNLAKRFQDIAPPELGDPKRTGTNFKF